MQRTNYRLWAFIAFILVQLSIMGQMVYHREAVLRDGRAFKFQCAPFDPSDPFRGKYIQLAFAANQTYSYDNSLRPGQEVFALLYDDSEGFAQISDVTREAPQGIANFYVKAKVQYYDSAGSTVTLAYPFERFYMSEAKAQPAEDLYRRSVADNEKKTYAVVRVPMGGEPVLETVMIDGTPIADLVKEKKEKEE